MKRKSRKKFITLHGAIRTLFCIVCVVLVAHPQAFGEDKTSKDDQGYRIDKPGTITFTVGVKIKGKVEKPQVMIFLPKEKPYYRDVNIMRSFYNDIMEPLPLRTEEKQD